ncbi:aspartate--ammonia ligase [Prevotella sp. PCHR]|uniref:Aspartate--ammonia ligase n=1 Tax=Xylanibacter caecicola TaxID=2736294 RepID=A0ABX2AYR5_9BACT|nr:aspartate--ammonia ligase [Xylanibacter caecicola]NPE24361.1 aspartate--ammonia ligase [Xylanibacter caecicola]
MSKLIVPEDYVSLLGMRQTEQGIKLIKEFFQQNLSTELRLRRVTAPLFVLKGLGINDDLNGVERPVTFPIKDLGEAEAEVVHSLAKWKRLTLAEYEVEPGYGIYTDMNAIRADEELDNLHSLYVDQWDWEAVITAEQRNIDFLKSTVRRIYAAILRTEFLVCERYPQIKPFLPEDIRFIYSEDLLAMYPDKDAKERENLICKKYGAVFVIGIGGSIGGGEPHDGRAPDYDDWTTESTPGHHGLNGDILIWYPVLGKAVELSSMGIRVDGEALMCQLELKGQTERASLYFHKKLLDGELPLSIGGGIGQSRLCMVLLHKAHLGEIQASIWPDEMKKECEEAGMMII